MNERARALACNVLGAVDRRVVAGLILGVGLAVAGLAQSQSAPTGLCALFPGLCSPTAPTGPGPNVGLITSQASVVASTLQAQQNDCANGGAGTLGEAIRNSMDIHSRIASATPEVEQFFDINGSCFSSISQIFDLSFAIPSLSSIIASATNAVLQYAQRQVCTMVHQVTSSVTTPINSAISDINSLGTLGNINGLTGSAVNGALSQVSPTLGSGYSNPPPTGTVTIGTNPFNQNQTGFNPNPTNPTPGNPTSPTTPINPTPGSPTTPVQTINAQAAALMTQIASQQIVVGQSQLAYDQANQAYQACSGSGMCAGNEAGALMAAQTALINAQNALMSLQQQLAQLQVQAGQLPTPAPAPTQQASIQSAQMQAQQARSQPSGLSGSLSQWFNRLVK